jgi:xylose isomerase
MRTYLILQEKVERFNRDAEIQGVLAELRAQDEAYDGATARSYSREDAEALKQQAFDPQALAARGRRYEELDQLVIELLLGAR